MFSSNVVVRLLIPSSVGDWHFSWTVYHHFSTRCEWPGFLNFEICRDNSSRGAEGFLFFSHLSVRRALQWLSWSSQMKKDVPRNSERLGRHGNYLCIWLERSRTGFLCVLRSLYSFDWQVSTGHLQGRSCCVGTLAVLFRHTEVDKQ